ncbi:hypothetical protein BX616_006250 [Lobosporangium transversale]|nr:hypothetical protein BX616_006250 [Lobosporangium transversale]
MIEKLGAVPMTEGMFGSDPEEATCAICLGNYVLDETIRVLPCQHHFHLECVDQWLFTDKSCPLCKHDIDKPILNSFRRNSDLMTQSSGINNININIHHSNNSPSMDRIQIIIA